MSGQAHQPYGASFPLLEVGELIEQFRTMDYPVTEQDLLHPTSNRVITLYEWWMIEFMGLNTEDCMKAAEAQMDVMEHSEIHLEAMFVGVVQLTMNQLLVRCAVDDFTTRDITAPTTTRLTKIFSALVNFHLYVGEQREEYLNVIVKEADALGDRETELLTSTQDLREKIATIKAEREANKVKIPATEDLINKAKAKLKECKVDADKLGEQHGEIRNDLLRLTAENNDMVQTITNQSIEINRLKGQIVQSPDRMRSNIVELKNTLDREGEALKALEQKERSMLAQITAIKRYETDLGQCIRILDEWDIDNTKMQEARSRYRKHSDLFETLVNEHVDLEKQITILERRIQFARDEVDRFDARCETRRTQARTKKKLLEDQHGQLLEQKRILDLQAASKNREAAEVENHIKEIHAELFKELEKGEMDFKRIKEQVSLYSIKLNKALDSINALNAQPFETLVAS